MTSSNTLYDTVLPFCPGKPAQPLCHMGVLFLQTSVFQYHLHSVGTDGGQHEFSTDIAIRTLWLRFSLCSLTESSQMLCEQDTSTIAILQMGTLGDSREVRGPPRLPPLVEIRTQLQTRMIQLGV